MLHSWLSVQGGDTRILSVRQSVSWWLALRLSLFFSFLSGVWCFIVHMVVWCLSGVCLSVDGAVTLCACGGVLSVRGRCGVCLYLWLCGVCLGLVRCLPQLVLVLCVWLWLVGGVCGWRVSVFTILGGGGGLQCLSVLVMVRYLSVFGAASVCICGSVLSFRGRCGVCQFLWWCGVFFCGWGVCLYLWLCGVLSVVVWCLICG